MIVIMSFASNLCVGNGRKLTIVYDAGWEGSEHTHSVRWYPLVFTILNLTIYIKIQAIVCWFTEKPIKSEIWRNPDKFLRQLET